MRLLERVEELKVLTSVADAGLLSAAEDAGVFSKLEAAGAFSSAEKLLPLGAPLAPPHINHLPYARAAHANPPLAQAHTPSHNPDGPLEPAGALFNFTRAADDLKLLSTAEALLNVPANLLFFAAVALLLGGARSRFFGFP